MKIVLLLLLFVPLSEPVHDEVDRIERNTVLNDVGKSQLEQLIFWRWQVVAGEGGGFHVAEWRLVSDCAEPVLRGSRWRLQWLDRRDVYRVVTAKSYLVTRTWCHDPEVFDRHVLPSDRRLGFRK